jgi:hypothetical protein
MPLPPILGAALALLIGSALVGCGDDKIYEAKVIVIEAGPPAPIAVALVTTDLRTPEDIDSMRFEQLYADADFARWTSSHELGPTDLVLPAAFYLNSGATARVRVTAWKGATALLVDEAVVDWPAAESMAFDLRLDRACLGQVAQDAAGAVRSSCAPGQTCRGGSCVSIDRNRELRPWTGDVDAALAAAPLGDQ